MQTNPAGQISKRLLSGIKTKLLLLSASHFPSLPPPEKWRPHPQLRTAAPHLFCTKYTCVLPAPLLLRPQSGGEEGLNPHFGGRKSKADVWLSFLGTAVTHQHLSHASERVLPNMTRFASVLLTWAFTNCPMAFSLLSFTVIITLFCRTDGRNIPRLTTEMRRSARPPGPASVRVRAGGTAQAPSIPIPEINVCKGPPRPATMHRAREMPLTLGSCAQSPPGSEQSLSRALHAVTLGSPVLNPGVSMGKMQGTQRACVFKTVATGVGPSSRGPVLTAPFWVVLCGCYAVCLPGQTF